VSHKIDAMGAALALAVMLVVIVAILSLAVNTQGPPQTTGHPLAPPSRGARGGGSEARPGGGGPRPSPGRATRNGDAGGKEPANKDRRKGGADGGKADVARGQGGRGESRGNRGKLAIWRWLARRGAQVSWGRLLWPRHKSRGQLPAYGGQMRAGAASSQRDERLRRGEKRGRQAAERLDSAGGTSSEAEPSLAERLLGELKPLSSQAEAVVMAVVDERTLGPVTKSRLTLRVEPSDGDAFEVTTRVAFPTPEERARVKVGGRVPVRYDSSDHRRVVVEMGGDGPEPGPAGG
jgi:hypothetical protein